MLAFGEALLPFQVGGLMYTPAINTDVGKKLCENAFQELDSLVLCLEDAIGDNGVDAAELQLVKTLTYLSHPPHNQLPLLFVRVRNHEQFGRLPALLGDLLNLLTGVVFPKFDLSNALEYCLQIERINANRAAPLYFMPILESQGIINLATRNNNLLGIRKLLDASAKYVLNVRVGAMDFCKPYGLRRTVHQTIYDLSVVRQALSDVLTVFSDDYVVSAPVWEYFQGDGNNDWALGLERELQLDIANGFIGKTMVHPSQIPYVKKWLKPNQTDYEDAKSILNWEDETIGVLKSTGGNRMNEMATHQRWAMKIMMLAQVYGVRAE